MVKKKKKNLTRGERGKDKVTKMKTRILKRNGNKHSSIQNNNTIGKKKEI